MTNREYLIAQLRDEDFIDDSGASYEATVLCAISCPYYMNDERAICKRNDINRDNCFKCKQEWLDSEVDE